MPEQRHKLQVTYTHEEDLLPPLQPVQPQEWQEWGIWALLLALIVFATYVPMLGTKLEPIYQDDLNLRNNPFLLSGRGWTAIWRYPHLHFQQFSPLGYSLFWIEMNLPRTISEWFRMDAPFEYLRLTHLVNILLHLGNAMLLWTLLKKLEIRGAWLAAAIFAVHPLQVEPVAWMSQQPMLLGMFLGLTSLILYLRYCGVNPMPFNPYGYFKLPETGWILYTLSVLLLILAVLAKPWMAILPLVILILIWWERGKIAASDLKPLAPMLLITLATVGGAIFFLSRDPNSAVNYERPGVLSCVAAAGRAMWTYALKLVVPYPLSFVYPRWDLTRLAALQLLFPVMVVVVLAVLFLLRKRFGRAVFAGGLLMVLTLLPAVVYFNEMLLRGGFVANHCAYLAVAVFAAGVASILAHCCAPAQFKPQYPSNLLALMAIVALVTYSIILSWPYQKSEKLWKNSIERYENAHFARIELAQLKLEVRDNDAAEREFRAVLREDPTNRRALMGNASILQAKGESEKSLGAYLQLLQRNPNDVEARIQLALCYLSLGDSARALEITQEVLSGDPANVDAINNLAFIAQSRGEYTQAMQFLNKAVELAPRIPGPRLNRANLFYRLGDIESAVTDITAVVEIHPNSFEAWFNAASMCANMAQSTLQAELAQGTKPEDAQRHTKVLFDQAEGFYRRALDIHPDSAIAHANLGKLLLLLGKYDAAVFSFKQASDLNPENLEYQGYLQQAEIRASNKPFN